jgi:molybdate transport system substrate-binding protein
MRGAFGRFVVFILLALFALPSWAAPLTVAAAADLKFALEDITAAFRRLHPEAQVDVVYGSSGKLQTQIRNGAPFDLFFSADIDYARALVEAGLASGPVRPYGRGRIVLWSTRLDVRRLSVADLTQPGIHRIALANPRHAPYGRRAEEALRAAGVWSRLAPKLLFAENIAQAAQFVQTGGAEVGIVALSLVKSPQLAQEGAFALIPEEWHAPLEQGFVITRRGMANPLARAFADFMETATARSILERYGFLPPGGVKAD